MNREQIIKALECCSCINDELTCGYDCYLYGGTFCQLILKKDVYSLIEELTEENERLKAQRYMVRSDGTLEMIPTVEQVRADTVQKMQERLKAEKFTHKNFGDLVCVDDIDQIAKEMLEGEMTKKGISREIYKKCEQCGQIDKTFLKPCHFCGSENVELDLFYLAKTYSIICNDCRANFSLIGAKGTDRGKVIRAWNGELLKENDGGTKDEGETQTNIHTPF